MRYTSAVYCYKLRPPHSSASLSSCSQHKARFIVAINGSVAFGTSAVHRVHSDLCSVDNHRHYISRIPMSQRQSPQNSAHQTSGPSFTSKTTHPTSHGSKSSRRTFRHWSKPLSEWAGNWSVADWRKHIDHLSALVDDSHEKLGDAILQDMHERGIPIPEVHRFVALNGNDASRMSIPQLLEKKWVHWMVMIEDSKPALDVFCTFLKSNASSDQDMNNIQAMAESLISRLVLEQDDIDGRITTLAEKFEDVTDPEQKMDEKERAHSWAQFLHDKKTAVDQTFAPLCKALSEGSPWDAKEVEELSFRWERESKLFFHAQCACMAYLTTQIDNNELGTRYHLDPLSTLKAFDLDSMAKDFRKFVDDTNPPPGVAEDGQRVPSKDAVWIVLRLRERRNSLLEFREAANRLENNTAALLSPEFDKVSTVLKKIHNHAYSFRVRGRAVDPRNTALLSVDRRQCELESAFHFFLQWKNAHETVQAAKKTFKKNNPMSHFHVKDLESLAGVTNMLQKATILMKRHNWLFEKYQEELKMKQEQAEELRIKFRPKPTSQGGAGASDVTKNEAGYYRLSVPSGFRSSILPVIQVPKRTHAEISDIVFENDGEDNEGEDEMNPGSGKRVKSSASG
jgi:hypothetical protein